MMPTCPTLYEECVGSLTSHRFITCAKACETGPTVYRPYPRRLENLRSKVRSCHTCTAVFYTFLTFLTRDLHTIATVLFFRFTFSLDSDWSTSWTSLAVLGFPVLKRYPYGIRTLLHRWKRPQTVFVSSFLIQKLSIWWNFKAVCDTWYSQGIDSCHSIASIRM